LDDEPVVLKFGGWEFFLEEGKTPVGVVLVHEIFGFNDYIKSVAKEFSRNGYWAAAVDIFRGKKPSTFEEGRKVRESLTKEDVVDALGNGLKLLRERIGGKARVGTMGFCMGGGFALLGACNLEFDFCVNYYGIVQKIEEVERLNCPVQLVLGREDEKVNTWAFQSFLPVAMKFNKRVDLHLYPDSKHAFHRPDWEGHNPEASEDEWSKTLLFLSRFQQRGSV